MIAKKKVRDNCKQQWNWQVNAQADVICVLKQIAPFLVIKKEQAVKCMAALEDAPVDQLGRSHQS